MAKKLFVPFKEKDRVENKQRMLEFFYKRLEKTVNDNQNRKSPYYITYRVKFENERPWVAKDIMLVHDEFPEQLIAGTMVHKVDNSTGTCELLRVIEP